MKFITAGIIFSAVLAAAMPEQTFTGVITDSMCGADHKAMKIAPDAKCVAECMKSGSIFKYGLYDGKATYRLSDQETPGRFAGQHVKITGTLFRKTGIIQTTKIESAR